MSQQSSTLVALINQALPDVGSTFATADAPIFKLLSVLQAASKTDWANSLEAFLQEEREWCRAGGASVVPQEVFGHVTGYPDLVVAQILDIDESNKTNVLATLRAIDLLDLTKTRDAVNAFIEALRECQNITHTRLLLLNKTSNELKTPIRLRRLLRLFYAHLMGIEFNLRMREIRWLYSFAHGEAPVGPTERTRLSTTPGLLLLGDDAQSSFGAVRWVGRRKVGQHEPWLGLIIPPAPSLFPVGTTDNGQYGRFANDLIARHQPIGSGSKSLSDQQVPGHWVAVLLQMQYWLLFRQVHAAERSERGLLGGVEPYISRSLKLWEEYASLAANARFLSTRAIALKGMIPLLSTEDYSDVENLCADLAITVQHRADAWSRQVESTSKRVQLDASEKSIEMAQLSIDESRSAIALTVLAFAFVPISLSSSVFGMNIQEINQSGHSIWVFVLTSVVLVLVAVCGWLVWRSIRNWRQMCKRVDERCVLPGDELHKPPQLVGSNGLFILKHTLLKLWNSREISRWRKLALVVGIRSVQQGDNDKIAGDRVYPAIPGEAYRNPSLVEMAGPRK